MNTAERLSNLLNDLVGKGRANDIPMVKVWGEVFGLPLDTPHLEDDVVTCIQGVRMELELLRTKLLAMGAPEKLLQPGLARFRNFSSTSYLNQQWSGLKDEISKPENRIPFMWAAWVLRDENEEILPDDELSALRSELDSLENSLQETDMAPYLRSFVQRQIDAIRSALLVYRVQGVKPIETALKQVAGDCAFERTRLEAENATASEPTKGILARASALIEKTAKVADSLDKIRKASEGACSLAASVGPVLLTWAKALPING